MDEVSALGLSLDQPSGCPPCDCSTYPQWRHRGGGGKGRASPLDGNAPCRTTVVAFGDLLVFKTTQVIAEPKKELTEILPMLKQSASSFFGDGI